jgi:3-hydroxyacyl-[acyl-carrier-protein] dehydratase
MPPQYIFDISALDLTKVLFDQEAIRQENPQRGAMEMLDAIVYIDPEHDRLIGYKDIRENEFWVDGHIPGRPLFPGVLMIEAAAQLASFYTRKFLKWEGFIGFGGVEDCRFRAAITPPSRFYILGKQIWHRHGRVCCKEQGIVNGNIVFETTIIGVRM